MLSFVTHAYILAQNAGFVPAASLRLTVLADSAYGSEPANIVSNLPCSNVTRCVLSWFNFMSVVLCQCFVFIYVVKYSA